MDEGKYLDGARRNLIEQRQALIKGLALGLQREQLEANLTMIVKVQGVLEILDTMAASNFISWRRQKEPARLT